MEMQELKELIQAKNEFPVKQTRRIILLIEKPVEARRNCLQYKHFDVLVHL